MKKIIAISMLTVSLAATSAFGQGWLQLSSGRSQAWDAFTTPGVGALTSHINAALFWAPGANAANPMSLANTPTTGNLAGTEAAAWTALLTSGWTMAQDSSSGNNNVIVTTTTRGAVGYAPVGGGSVLGAGWSINGSAVGGTVSLLEVGWNSAYATPAAAQAAGSAIGWSYLNTFALATGNSDPNIALANFTNFGVLVSVPEPTTIALAGLGGLSLLLFRRRK